jgi:hypothetical protein
MEHHPTTPPDPQAHDDPVYGPAFGQVEPAPRRFPRLALAGGLMAALALGGAGIAYAADSGGSSPSTPAASSTPTTTTPSGVPQGPGKGHRFGGAGMGLPGLGLPGLGGKLLYGQATIEQPDGTLKTVEFQMGTVSSVSSSSITVSSGANGNSSYSHTYKVDPSTIVDSQAGGISTVAKGDQVRVIATQQNGSDTAVNIVDATKINSSRTGFGFGAGRNGNAGTGNGGAGGATTNPPAGSTGAVWGYPGGQGGPGGAISGPFEAQ